MIWIKVIRTNIVVLLGLVVAVEFAYFFYDRFLRDTGESVRCEPGWVLYNYCPDINTSKLNNEADGGLLVNIEVDSLGGRVKPGHASTVTSARRFLIGDSFIQADEMDYLETIYGRFNLEEPGSTYALGYSSWNPKQYFDAIKRIGRENSDYYVFLMTNDVNPAYDRSVYAEHRSVYAESKVWIPSFVRRTFTYKVLAMLKRKISIFTETHDVRSDVGTQFTDDNFSENFIDQCGPLDDYRESDYSRRIGFDYLVFAKGFNCWPQLHKDAYEEFVAVVREMKFYVINDLSSSITFVWVGGGWNHQEQNTIGRLSPEYGFSTDVTITQQGLIREFISSFPSTKVVDTEQLINDAIMRCNENCTDKFFYPVDGHWTPSTHQLVFNYLQKL